MKNCETAITMKLRSSKNKIIKRRIRTPVKKNENTHLNLIKMVERYNDDLKICKMLIDFEIQMDIEFQRKEEMKTMIMVDFNTMSFVCPELEYWNVQF